MQGSYSLQPMPLMTWNDKRDSIIQNHALLGSAVTFLKKHPFIKKKGLFFYLQNVPFMDLAFFFALSGNYIFFCSPGQTVISLPQKTLVLNCLKRLTYDPCCSFITYLHHHKTDSHDALLVATLICLKYKE